MTQYLNNCFPYSWSSQLFFPQVKHKVGPAHHLSSKRFEKYIYFYFMFMRALPAYIHVYQVHMSGMCRGQNRVADPLELE